MRAMMFTEKQRPLSLKEISQPLPREDQLLIRIHACGVCRTDLHIFDGDLSLPNLPLIPGHQIVGTVVSAGKATSRFSVGERVGIPWLGRSCGSCPYCLDEAENLCDNALFTGYSINGGYADYCVAYEQFCFSLPQNAAPTSIAPLLCAGIIGYRSYRMSGRGEKVGFYGYGAAARLLIQVALYEGKKVYAFTKCGDEEGQRQALQAGAVWAGGSKDEPPQLLDAAIIFAPAGELIPYSLKAVKKGGSVVCAGIHMSDIPSFPYAILWEERMLRSVANLTRSDGVDYLNLAAEIPVSPEVEIFPLESANEAVEALRAGKLSGSAVLKISDPTH